MTPIHPDMLAMHIALLARSSEGDRDELLTDLMVHSWKTKEAQNS